MTTTSRPLRHVARLAVAALAAVALLGCGSEPNTGTGPVSGDVGADDAGGDGAAIDVPPLDDLGGDAHDDAEADVRQGDGDSDIDDASAPDVGPRCGDGVVDEGEACDDGDEASDELPDRCRTDCTAPTCGDGVVDTGEECDDGDDDDENGCDNECRRYLLDLCASCASDGACGGTADRCVTVGDGDARACGIGCDEDADCPAGFSCQPRGASGPSQCVPESGDCSGCVDGDGDGFGFGDECAEDGFDCAPDDPTSFPDAEEVCDGVDNDCDGEIDEGLETTQWWPDLDGDGHGDESVEPIEACEPPEGHTDVGGDCDDEDPARHPGAPELCDEADNDCDEEIDEAVEYRSAWPDADGDGFGDATAESEMACVTGEGLVFDNTDCDDADETINPAAEELCNGRDDNCDGTIGEGLDAQSFWPDADGDGFGDATADPISACAAPEGHVANAQDCDDGDGDISPDATEACDGVDNDCDGTIDRSLGDTPLSRSCYSGTDETRGVGACSDGFQTCRDATWSDCQEETTPTDEICDEADNDCDGETDEGVAPSPFWPDRDADGFGDGDAEPTIACTQPSGFVENGDDCDDSSGDISPSSDEIPGDGVDEDCDGFELCFVDEDGDGFRTRETVETEEIACEGTGLATGSSTSGDCDDENATIFPGAAELCDALDNDCDGAIDETSDVVEFWPDGDGDGFGDASADPVEACIPPENHVPNGDDCNDEVGTIHPDAAEMCDGVDNDCDGDIDADATDARTFYADEDGDGFGDPDAPREACERPAGFVGNDDDCNDEESDARPDGREVPGDGIDGDCDGLEICFVDGDDDGFLPDAATTRSTEDFSCSDPGLAGADAPTGDCDDTRPSVSPGATELCDELDNDCDGMVDEDVVTRSLWPDNDRDGFGDSAATPTESCEEIDGFVGNGDDCNDADPAINPEAAETCDGIDNDCDDVVDPPTSTDASVWFQDADGDGFGATDATETACEQPAETSARDGDCDDTDEDVFPGAPEIAGDGVDQSCDGRERCFVDGDDDGFRSADGATVPSERLACDAAGQADAETPSGDCDDDAPLINPGAEELCADGLDNDCNGDVDCSDAACGEAPVCSPCVPDTIAACGRVSLGELGGPGSTDDIDAWECASGDFEFDHSGPEQAFEFVATCDGPVTFEARPTDGSVLLAILDLFIVRPAEDGTCSAAGCVEAGMFQLREGSASVTFDAIEGETLYAVVDARGGATDIPYELTTRCGCDPVTEICDNGRDDDGDGEIDCLDSDCFGEPECEIIGEEICDNGRDDDRDGAIDCADFDCILDPLCEPSGEEICDNGVDDDEDGAIDCEDLDCRLLPTCVAVEICDNGIDDDFDFAADCDDTDCVDDPACETGSEEICDNGIDDDEDGAIDCDDTDCEGAAACEPPAEICDNGLDDDEDGAIDCLDSDCFAQPACAPSGEEICDNGIDDDDDGAIDCTDLECVLDPACSDRTEICDNGFDDDFDFAVDCADPDCEGDPACVTAPDEICDNGVDDDEDGATDCDDEDCASDAACAAPSCEPASDLTCGDTGLGRLGAASNTDSIDAWACASSDRTLDHSGPEAAYSWTAECDGNVTFTATVLSLDGSPATADIFVVRPDSAGTCAPEGCIGAGLFDSTTATATVTTSVNAGDELFVVIDGRAGHEGASFAVEADCACASSEVCDNGVDDDLDGSIDCDDTDCVDDASCVVPVDEICDNEVDDDLDGAIDCEDDDCVDHRSCLLERPEVCDNEIDDDFDGRVDCADPDCIDFEDCESGALEICDNGIDDDFDSQIDCDDPDCTFDEACRISFDEICDNDFDDDFDALIDCDDPDCASDPACGPDVESNCDNGIDDDSDGAIDCVDTDCASDPVCETTADENCTNETDDDGDGDVDCDDVDCIDHPSCGVSRREICDNGVDDDLDLRVDCHDLDCIRDRACRGVENCVNFTDDDGDDLIDCEDPDCFDSIDCLAER